MTIYTTDSSFSDSTASFTGVYTQYGSTGGSTVSDSTASFTAVTCVVFRAKMCSDGAVALTTTTSSYTNDAYVVTLEGPQHSQFDNSKIYAV